MNIDFCCRLALVRNMHRLLHLASYNCSRGSSYVIGQLFFFFFECWWLVNYFNGALPPPIEVECVADYRQKNNKIQNKYIKLV